MQDLQEELRSLRRSKNAPNETRLFQLFQQFADETSVRANKPKVELCLRTCQNLKSKLDLRKRAPQYMTDVRVKSASDLRMTYSMVLMVKSCLEFKLPPLIWNWDATQFIVRVTATGAAVYILGADDDPTPVTAIGNSGLDFAIKWMFLGSAAGDAAPLVFIIAVPELPPGKWQVYEIRGLSATTDSGKIGYLVIGHDRHGTSDFFQWFLKNIVITTIVKTRTDNDLKDENGMWSETSVSCDGESIIMNEVFTNAIISELQDYEIILSKIAASCSHIHQAADMGPVFRALKAHLAAITRKGLSVENKLLDLRIMEALGKLEVEFNITLPAEKKDKFSFGLRTLVKTMKDLLTADLIMKSFERTGQCPVDFDKIIGQCYTSLDQEMRTHMSEHLAHDVPLFRAQGRLTEAQYEESGIPTLDDPDDKPRDERALQNERAVLLSHPKTVERRLQQVNSSLPLGNALMAPELSKQERKELQDAAKAVDRRKRSDEKKEADHKERENRTPAQKQADAVARKERTEQNRLNAAAKFQQQVALLEKHTGGPLQM